MAITEWLSEQIRAVLTGLDFKNFTNADIIKLFRLKDDPLVAIAQIVRLIELINQTCRIIDKQAGESRGTGFLVAPDLLLTSHHVVDGFEPKRLECLFNNYELVGGVTTPTPTPASVADVVAFSPSPGSANPVTADELDFSLLRLTTAFPASRKYLPVLLTAAREGEPILAITHEYSEGPTIRQGEVRPPYDRGTHFAFPHGMTAGDYASGAPVVNDYFDLIGMHRGELANSDDNHAVAMIPILNLIEQYLPPN